MLDFRGIDLSRLGHNSLNREIFCQLTEIRLSCAKDQLNFVKTTKIGDLSLDPKGFRKIRDDNPALVSDEGLLQNYRSFALIQKQMRFLRS